MRMIDCTGTVGIAVAVACAMMCPSEASLTFHCTFDDTDNPLAATVGANPEVVDYYKNTPVTVASGLGNCSLAMDSDVLAGLPSGSGALSIPARQALRIPHGVPTDSHHPWAMAVRFYLPNDGLKYHTIFSNNQTPTDASLFLKLENGKIRAGGGTDTIGWGYTDAASLEPGAWHVIALSFQNLHICLYIDGKLVYDKPYTIANSYAGRHTLNNHPYVFLSCDEADEDNLMHFDWVKIWDEAEPPDLFPSRRLVGLWEFPSDNPTQATIGEDLELFLTKSGQTLSSSSVAGLVPGDGAMRLNQYTAYKVRHCIQNQPYTVVIDAKMPSGVTRPKVYHTLWHENGASHVPGTATIPDPTISLRSDDNENPKRIRFWGQSGQDDLVMANGRYVYEDEWVRYVITWDGVNRSFYANGGHVFTSTRVSSLSTAYSYLHGDLDGQGEESPLDFTTMALYEGAMSADEVAQLGGPVGTLASVGDSYDALPAGEWVMGESADGTVPSRIGEDLSVVAGGYEWRHATPSDAAVLSDLVYVVDLDVAANFSGGTFLTTANGVNVQIDGSGRVGNAGIGWSAAAPLSVGRHRVVIANTDASRTDVFVDGVLRTSVAPLGKLVDASNVRTDAQTIRFLEPSGATLTSVAVYPTAVCPAGAPLPASYDPSVPGDKAQPAPGAVTLSSSSIVPGLAVNVVVPCAAVARDWYATEIDFGDGARFNSGWLRYGDTGYGTSVTYSHAYEESGVYPVRVRTYDAQHRVSTWTTAGTVTVRSELASEDVIETWPWQQNVYTNRFTIMCETKIAVDGLQLQWGEDFANTVEMTGVAGNGGTWIYTARVAVPDAVGASISYRLAASGSPLTGVSTTGTVRLWPDDPDESFSCAVWGDNQQGAREGDWDADVCLFARRIFEHMAARDFDFGITAGDMSTGANYAREIKPLDLEVTDGLFGATRPYYVAWGNHDTLYPAVKSYFETGAVNEPGYGTSACGNYHLYRGNVLFAFVDHQLRDAPETVQWLSDLLATPRARTAKFRILVQHFPIFGETGNTLCAALLNIVKTGGVDLVIAGHMHGYERIEKDGFIQLTNGGLGCLDHHETPVNDYGDCTKIGGHNPLPYLWARQRSFTEPGVLGLAEPVRLGMIQGYGELAVSGGTLTYRAHGFNADGSYIGVFDTVTITSKTVGASAVPPPTDGVCADPGAFASFTSRPVTNAKWKEFADAVGLSFSYPDGAGDFAVTGVSKTEINRFLAWLNGGTGTYRLPTCGELAEAFGGNLARDVSEWTASVDPATGRCLILGGNTNAVAGTWCRATDRPMIATADCSANYLGFRLATGPAPAEPSDAFGAALAQLGELANPGVAYRWSGGTLIDISSEVANPSGALAYSDPVIFTGSGGIMLTSSFDVAFRGGLAAPNASSFTKAGAGTLVVGGPLKGGPVTSSEGWALTAQGSLQLENVSSDCTCLRFRSGDCMLRLVGENDLKSAVLPIAEDTVTNFVAVSGAATLKARSVRDYDGCRFRFGENLTLQLVEDLKCRTSEVTFDGLADMDGFNELENLDPWILGRGTLRTTHLGNSQNSYIRLAVSNIVFTSADPWRQNAPKYSVDMLGRRDRYEVAADGVRIASLFDWTMPAHDHFGIEREFMGFNGRVALPRVVFDTLDPDDGVTAHTFVLAPTRTTFPNDVNRPWSFDVTGPGTVIVDTPCMAQGVCTVRSGTLRLAEGRACSTATLRVESGATLELGGSNALGNVTFAGGTLRPADGGAFTGDFSGPFVLDQPDGASFVMRTGLVFDGAVTLADGTDKARVQRLFEGPVAEGVYSIFSASGLAANQVEITHDVPDTLLTSVDVTAAGDVALIVQAAPRRMATWVGEGDRDNPLDSRNWSVSATNGAVVTDGVPDAETYLVLRGETALNVPQGTAFAYAGFICSDRATLADDCDWRGLGTVQLRAGAVLDLHGRRLALAGLEGSGTAGAAEITDTTDDRIRPGELHVDVPAGVDRTNGTVRLSGNLRLVKDGAGTFTANLSAQSYSGGTYVQAGTFASHESLSISSCGAFGSDIVVARDAVFDRKGRSGLENYLLRLDGGTLTCSYNPTIGDHKGSMGSLEITADSRIVFDAGLAGRGNQGDSDLTVVSSAIWELHGHTLDIVFDGQDPDVYCNDGMQLRHGTIRTTMASNGWFHDRGIDGSDGGCLDLATILRLNCNGKDGNGTVSSISNLTLRTTLNNVTSDGYQKVYGTFRPLSPYFYKIEFQDGATLALGEKTGAWSIVPANSSSATATFADNATIALDLGERTFSRFTKVVSWNVPPANLDTLTFVQAPGTRKVKLRVDNEGVWAFHGQFAIIFR